MANAAWPVSAARADVGLAWGRGGGRSALPAFPSYGLAYLLKQYANVDADKKYQLADWRIRYAPGHGGGIGAGAVSLRTCLTPPSSSCRRRGFRWRRSPLPEEMFRYAREDTHYLLYIYDRLRNELLAAATADARLVREVLQRSEDVALKRYVKEPFDPDGYRIIYAKAGLEIPLREVAVLKALYGWRDTIARDEDESPRFVLPNHLMIRLAQALPLTAASVVAAVSPVPPLVRVHATDLALLVRTTQAEALAKAQGLADGPGAAAPATAATVPAAASVPVSKPSDVAAPPAAVPTTIAVAPPTPTPTAAPRAPTPLVPSRPVSIVAKARSSLLGDDDDDDDEIKSGHAIAPGPGRSAHASGSAIATGHAGTKEALEQKAASVRAQLATRAFAPAVRGR